MQRIELMNASTHNELSEPQKCSELQNGNSGLLIIKAINTAFKIDISD